MDWVEEDMVDGDEDERKVLVVSVCLMGSLEISMVQSPWVLSSYRQPVKTPV